MIISRTLPLTAALLGICEVVEVAGGSGVTLHAASRPSLGGEYLSSLIADIQWDTLLRNLNEAQHTGRCFKNMLSILAPKARAPSPDM